MSSDEAWPGLQDLLCTESRDRHWTISTSSIGSIQWCRDPVDRQVIWILCICAPGL